MAEFNIEQKQEEQAVQGEFLKNVKEIKIGNGRWKQDKNALRMYDDSGNVVIFMGFE